MTDPTARAPDSTGATPREPGGTDPTPGEPPGADAPVERVAASDPEGVVAVLAESFSAYPVMRYVLGGQDDERLRLLVRFFTMARVLRGEPLLGVRRDGRLVAAALASFPDGSPSPAALAAMRDEVWAALGAAARGRYEAFARAASASEILEPHVHLNMLGVRQSFRGMGLGVRLIEEVRRISRGRAGSVGVTLSTEDPVNVPYYQRLGFQVVGYARVSPQLESWSFFLPD